MKKGSSNAFQVASGMKWDINVKSWDFFPIPQKGFATGEAIAHLKYLGEKGVAFKQKLQEQIVYSLNADSGP